MTERALLLAMRALETVRGHLVVIDGTAHRLFLLHPLAQDPGFDLLMTEDIDLAAPLELQHDGSRQLLDRLLTAGFEPRVSGAEYPAYTYPLQNHSSAYLQFIANLTGSGTTRDGSRDRLMRFSGIHAEKLRHVDVLLHAPWEANLEREGDSISVRVANPSAYVLQKLLTLRDRRPAKRAKDLLYIFDTLALCSDTLSELGDQTQALVPELSNKAAKRARTTADEHCFTEGRSAHEAARIAGDQRQAPPTAQRVVAGCRLGLTRMLPTLFPVGT